jgi:hypothetical protein
LRKAILALLVAVSLVSVTSVASAAGGVSPPRLGKVLGLVHSQASLVPLPSGLGNLVYHNGPVMHTNTSYAIYWLPSGYSVASDYRSLLDRFLGDVGADSGKTSNVYYADTQYSDGAGNISYNSSLGGSVVDTNPFPASGCTDTVSQTTVCLSDAQIQAEVQRVAGAQGWGNGPTKLFFMFTPRGVGSCADSSNCAFSQYCAYHSNFSSAAGSTLYANQPYADTVPAACDAGNRPNGDDADATINVTSHEHNEAITDALGTAWYDRRGYENGDKCAWNFGTQLGGGSGAQYNQLINGHTYELQQEWSNKRSGCVLQGL